MIIILSGGVGLILGGWYQAFQIPGVFGEDIHWYPTGLN
jgi:hypothetical protein